jgi:hypothetical protein
MHVLRGEKSMKRICMLLLIIILISGCTIQKEASNENSPVLESTANLKDDRTNIYEREYYEKEAITLPRVMYFEGNGSLKVYPYINADTIKEIKDMYVIIHTVVLNENGEEWALVELTDYVNVKKYGYVELTRLTEKPYTPLNAGDKEVISDIGIGDTVEEAIVQFGSRYDIYKSEKGWGYSFNKENGYIFIEIDPISNTVKSIFVNADGHETKEGFQVGDNAMEVIKSYKSKYEMNTDHHLFTDLAESTFDLGDGYVIEFKFSSTESEELTKESFVTYIYLYNIYEGAY